MNVLKKQLFRTFFSLNSYVLQPFWSLPARIVIVFRTCQTLNRDKKNSKIFPPFNFLHRFMDQARKKWDRNYIDVATNEREDEISKGDVCECLQRSFVNSLEFNSRVIYFCNFLWAFIFPESVSLFCIKRNEPTDEEHS